MESSKTKQLTSKNTSVTNYEPDAIIKAYDLIKVNSIKDIVRVRKEVDSIWTLSKSEIGNEIYQIYLSREINKIREFTGAKNFLSEAGFEYISEKLSSEPPYSSLTLLDIQLFAKMVYDGKFGEMYENVSVTKFVSWLDQYMSDRLLAFEQKAINDHKTIKNQTTESGGKYFHELPPELQEEINKSTEKLMAKKKSRKPIPYKNIGDYMKRNNLDDSWLEARKEAEYKAFLMMQPTHKKTVDVFDSHFRYRLAVFLNDENKKLNDID